MVCMASAAASAWTASASASFQAWRLRAAWCPTFIHRSSGGLGVAARGLAGEQAANDSPDSAAGTSQSLTVHKSRHLGCLDTGAASSTPFPTSLSATHLAAAAIKTAPFKEVEGGTAVRQVAVGLCGVQQLEQSLPSGTFSAF